MKRSQGVTLVELMVTVAVLAIIAMIAVPSFQNLIIQNRVTSITNDFVAALQLARSEAIRRGHSVTVCKSSDGTNCVTSGNTWEIGWIVFHDTNGNSARDGSEPLVRVWPALPAGYTLRPNSATFNNAVRFTAQGRLSAGVGATFQTCRNGTAQGRDVVIDLYRIRTQQGNCP